MVDVHRSTDLSLAALCGRRTRLDFIGEHVSLDDALRDPRVAPDATSLLAAAVAAS
jgi:hypothetical protein